MSSRFDRQCLRCGRMEVEQIDEWVSNYCPRCNDSMIERESNRQEWVACHPGEPCPEAEASKIR